MRPMPKWRRPAGAELVGGILIALSLWACQDINTDPKAVAAISLDSIAAPSIVVGDTLRDTLGVARPLRGTVFNIQGKAIAGYTIKYRAVDPGIHVDSLTGFATGDSVRSAGIRIVAEAAGIQTTPVSLFVVPSPDTVFTAKARDTLSYSLFDSTQNVSNALSLSVMHQSTATILTPVQGYLVSFAMQSPTDTSVALLVGDDGNRLSLVDTTASDGSAGRRVKVRPAHLTTSTDSVVVLGTVKYRGTVVKGSPIRLVLFVRPKS